MTGVKLTPKKKVFSFAYVETGNASEAYRRAYNAKNMKPETVNKRASELLNDGYITGMIEGLQAAHRDRHDVTVDGLTVEYEEARKLARKEAQPSAMVSATTGKAKLHGLIKDKHELTGKDGAPIEITKIERIIVKAPDTDG